MKIGFLPQEYPQNPVGKTVGFSVKTKAPLRTCGKLLSYLYEIHPFNLVSLSSDESGFEAVIFSVGYRRMTEALPSYLEGKAGLRIGKEKTVKDGARMLSFADTSRIIALLSLFPSENAKMLSCTVGEDGFSLLCEASDGDAERKVRLLAKYTGTEFAD